MGGECYECSGAVACGAVRDGRAVRAAGAAVSAAPARGPAARTRATRATSAHAQR